MYEFHKRFFNLLLDFDDEWVITNIESNHETQEVLLDVEYVSNYYEDPLHLSPAKLYDHTEVRVWCHLYILHYKSYLRCRIPLGLCKDGKIQEIKLIARGYRKFQNFRNAILFFHGGLDLYPLKYVVEPT